VLKSFPADAPLGFEPQSISARRFRDQQKSKTATPAKPNP
jgi:hypothetical protein